MHPNAEFRCQKIYIAIIKSVFITFGLRMFLYEAYMTDMMSDSFENQDSIGAQFTCDY